MPRLKYQPPYQDLHIYYLHGRVSGNPITGNDHFIGNWEEEGDSFLFFKEPADECVQALLRAQPHLSLQDQFQMTYEQWQGDRLTPLQVGRLKVVPPWHPEAAELDEMGILLDPGVVFGTGTHPTTHDCLSALELALEAEQVDMVLDLGTGTGLLALAAARLGARRVLAVDLNRLAVETARRNVIYNQLASRILTAQGNAMDFIDISSDLMVSNIHYAVMRPMLAQDGFSRHQQFILSGLLRSQAREIEDLLRRQPVEIIRKWERDATWFTFYGRRV